MPNLVPKTKELERTTLPKNSHFESALPLARDPLLRGTYSLSFQMDFCPIFEKSYKLKNLSKNRNTAHSIRVCASMPLGAASRTWWPLFMAFPFLSSSSSDPVTFNPEGVVQVF